jgi:hypothetical protein
MGLEEIRRKRGWSRFPNADKDASDMASHAQKLRQCIDSFLVGKFASWLDNL